MEFVSNLFASGMPYLPSVRFVTSTNHNLTTPLTSVYFQSHAETPDVQHKYAEAASLFLADIRMHIQMVLTRHLSARAELLTRSGTRLYTISHRVRSLT